MQSNNPVISNTKIVMFVVFVCAALFTSIFVYHLSHQTPAGIAPSEGTLFAAGRSIKSFELQTTNQQSFTQKDLYGHWTLLFFGFTHCSSICPTTLDMINRAYPSLSASQANLQVVLISLDPERDTAESLAKYAHSFNPAFLSATGKIQEIRKLQSQLGIFSEREGTQTDNYQIQHTSTILLINPKGQWVGVLSANTKPDQLSQTVKNSIKFLS